MTLHKEDKQFEADDEATDTKLMMEIFLGDCDTELMVSARKEVLRLLEFFPESASGLRLALVEGRVEGSTYYGECSCIKGTIRKLMNVKWMEDIGLVQDPESPAELWFLGIRKGDTDKDNPYSFLAVQWIDEFLSPSFVRDVEDINSENVVPFQCSHCGYQNYIPESLYESGEDITCKRCDKYIVCNGRSVDFSDTVDEG